MNEDPLVRVPIPPLVTLLQNLERQKGSDLSEEEVLSARDTAVGMMMRRSHRDEVANKRGFPDIDPENAWAEWQVIRRTLE